MKKLLNDFGGFITVFFIGSAILVAALLVFISINQSSIDNSLEGFTSTQRNKVIGRLEGNPTNKIKMIEFSDFQCPYCKVFHEQMMPQLRKEFLDTDIASIEYYPMTFLGEDSINSAKASICAQDQSQFWLYHDLLFYIQNPNHNNGTFSDDELLKLAEYIETEDDAFDKEVFLTCYNSGEPEMFLKQLQAQAQAYGIQSTPTVVINGVAVNGIQDITVYRQIVEKLLME
jgi:protein-disulfide isomerase|tara:strand:+ start:316 stop:1005 length:690 start_codon:yes stop_codon:yes gene_type:complete